METIAVEQSIDTFANVQPALVALPLDFVSAAHLPCEGLAPREVVEFRLPVHSYSPV